MPPALPIEVRFDIYDRHTRGETLHAIAQDLGIHYETARKWWRVGRRRGRQALVARPRKPIGVLRGVPPQVMELFNTLRRKHRAWGLPYLRQQLLRHPQLSPQERAQVPSLSSLYRYLHAVQQEPFKHKAKQHVPSTPLVQQTTHAHHLWQADLKEKYKLAGLPHRVTVMNMRDVYSSVTVGSEIFGLTRSSSTLTLADAQAACRSAFAQCGLPDRIRTDNGSCFVGTMAQFGFPSYLTLWLKGLGVEHETIDAGHATQNGCVERYNRTYTNLVLRDGPFDSMQQVRELSRTTVEFLNTTYPSHAGHCQGRPPLQAHPEAATPRRPYAPEHERHLFALERVDAYLAQFRWQRRADRVGKVSLGRTDYYLGRAHKGLVLDVTFDPSDRSFVFTTPDGAISLRRPALGLDTEDMLDIRTSQDKRLHDTEKAHRLQAYGK
jgi:transposase InsO family protein